VSPRVVFRSPGFKVWVRARQLHGYWIGALHSWGPKHIIVCEVSISPTCFMLRSAHDRNAIGSGVWAE
jgi:hypothetical protein